MELINNLGKTLRDDLMQQMHAGSRLSIAASCFSRYAFQELKEKLQQYPWTACRLMMFGITS